MAHENLQFACLQCQMHTVHDTCIYIYILSQAETTKDVHTNKVHHNFHRPVTHKTKSATICCPDQKMTKDGDPSPMMCVGGGGEAKKKKKGLETSCCGVVCRG